MSRACIGFILATSACATTAEAPVAHHGQHAHTMPHRFSNAEQWAEVFDDAARDAWQKPDAVIAALQLSPDAVVADLGAGTGYFTMRLARAVPQGKVFGIDIEPDMVRYLKERAGREGLHNVEGVLCSATDAALPPGVDLVLVVNTIHHIQDRVPYFTAVASRLPPAARLVIIDFTLQSEHGPPPQHRIDLPQLQQELGAAGFVLHRQHALLSEQYFVEFVRKP